MKRAVLVVLFFLSVISAFSKDEDNQSYGFVIQEQNFTGLKTLLFVEAGFTSLYGLTGGIRYRDMEILPDDLFLRTGGLLTNKSDESYIHTSGNLSIEKNFDKLKLQPFL